MTPLSYLTSCTPTKSNLYLTNSMAAAISEPALYRLQAFSVPNPCFVACFVPKHQSKSKASFHDSHQSKFFRWGFVNTPPIPQAGRQLLVSCPWLLAYSIHLQLPFILESVHPSATWGPAMPRGQGPTYHGK
jgi:hypothetical protein